MVESNPALEIEISYMKKSIDEIKDSMKDITIQLSENRKDFTRKFEEHLKEIKSDYVSKMEFIPYQDKVNGLQKGLLWIVGIVLASVIGAILKLVIL